VERGSREVTLLAAKPGKTGGEGRGFAQGAAPHPKDADPEINIVIVVRPKVAK